LHPFKERKRCTQVLQGRLASLQREETETQVMQEHLASLEREETETQVVQEHLASLEREEKVNSSSARASHHKMRNGLSFFPSSLSLQQPSSTNEKTLPHLLPSPPTKITLLS
jgi:hypothetical protein